MKSKLILLFGFFLFASCIHSTKDEVKELPFESKYNIELLYTNESVDSIPHSLGKIPTKGDLHLFFDEGFEHDSLYLYVNNIFYCKKELTTNSSTGYAEYILINKIHTLNSVSFRINNGRLCYSEIDKEKNVMRIAFMNKKLRVVFDNKTRIYD